MNMMTSLRGTAAMGRGLVAVRAEAQPKKPASFDELATAWVAFQAKHEQELREIKAGSVDILTAADLETVNKAISDIQGALDEQAKINAAAKLGDGAVIGDIQADPEYTAAFKAHMRKGERAPSEIQATMSKGTDADGGYLAPVEWDRTITNKLKQISPIRAHARVITISTAGFKKLFNDRNVGSGWVGETAARPETATPQIASLDFTTGEIYANPAISQQLLDDAAVDLESWLADEVDTEFARQEGIAFLSGNGTNKPHGILTYVTGGANAARHPFGAIQTVNSGAAAALTSDGILDLIYSLPGEFAATAKLFINRQSMLAARKLKDGNGVYLWQPSYASGQPQTLAGETIVEVPGMPAIAADAIAALYGDMDATYLVIDRIGIRVLRDPFTNKPFVHFYTTKRVGGGVHNPEPMRALKIGA